MSRFTVGLLLGLAYLGGQAQQAQITTPRDAVEGFAALDAQGARLHSGAADPIWKFTIDDGEPPVEPIVVIRSYAVTKATADMDSASVPVRFAVLGVVKDDGTRMMFVPARHAEVKDFTVLRSAAGWQITLAKLHVSPHVGVDGCIKHLDSLIADFDTEQKKVGPRYQSILRTRAAIQRLTVTH